MKKSGFKRIAAVVLLIAVMSLTVGCGGGQQAENADVTTVTIWHGQTHAKEFYDKKIEEYNETVGKEKGIKIECTFMSDLATQIDLALANDAAPDILMQLGTQAGSNLQKAAEAGQILPLEDVPGGQELIDKYEGYITPNGFDDKTYSVPYYAQTRALIYNKDMFKEAGLVDENGEPTPPETYDELVEYAKKLTDKSKDQYGIVLPAKWGNWAAMDWRGLMMQDTANSMDYDPISGTYDYTALKPIAEMYLRIKNDGSYLPGADSLDNDQARARFAEGRVGMKISASYDVGVLTDQFPAKCDWGVAPLPVADKNAKHMYRLLVDNFGCINAKSAKEKSLDKIFEVYKWFVSDELAVDTYKSGIFLPVIPEVIKDVKPEDISAPKQWAEYAALSEISIPIAVEMPKEYGEDQKHDTVIRDYIWTEKWTVDEAIKYLNESADRAVNRYRELHPDADYSLYIDEDWNNPERK